MKVSTVIRGIVTLIILIGYTPVTGDDGVGLELPVQLIGFPVIILAVRLSNFVKKLSYALNPRTYVSRSRRGTENGPDDYDIDEVENRLVKELGPQVCIFERVCTYHALAGIRNHHIGWNDLVRKFRSAPEGKKQYYMLSVFMGDIMGSPNLCHQLAKRGRGCG
ncbi:uncharacterized protein LOC142328014 [Lycorma delicatula]|uniref:uncharacterized protein LOC142328014 n=1 Tax=Lycorma delicatula TaxID=130591 RepID=UPI003F5143FE